MKLRLFNIICGISLIIVSFSISSCRSSSDPIGEGKETSVIINLKGVSDASESPLKQASINGIGDRSSFIAELPYSKDYNIIATITPETSSAKNMTQAAINPAAWTITPGPSSTTTPLAATVKYLVMVFDENGNRITAQEKIYDASTQSNTTNQMILDAGKNYTFIAVSYNTAVAPTFNASVTTLTDVINTITVDDATDYLYFNSGSFNIVSGQQNYINVNFRHINSRVSINLDAQDMGIITAISANISGTGSVNLTANGTTTAGNPTVYNKPLVFPTLGTRIILSNPVLVSSAGNAHTINITSVTVNNSTTRTNIPGLTVPAGVFQKGVNYKVNLSFQSTGILIGSLVWARGNLTYSNGVYYNRNRPEETGSNYANTDYWNFDSLLPVTITTNNATTPLYNTANITDPCTKIAGGKWRMPTLQDFTNLGYYNVHSNREAKYRNSIAAGDLINPNFAASAYNDILWGFPINGAVDPNISTVIGDANSEFVHLFYIGANEISGDIERLKFYKTGYYYGGIYQYLPNDYFTYMAIDSYANPGTNQTNGIYIYPPNVNYGSVNKTTTNRTFLNDRFVMGQTFTRDRRMPIRCVKNP